VEAVNTLRPSAKVTFPPEPLFDVFRAEYLDVDSASNLQDILSDSSALQHAWRRG